MIEQKLSTDLVILDIKGEFISKSDIIDKVVNRIKDTLEDKNSEENLTIKVYENYIIKKYNVEIIKSDLVYCGEAINHKCNIVEGKVLVRTIDGNIKKIKFIVDEGLIIPIMIDFNLDGTFQKDIFFGNV